MKKNFNSYHTRKWGKRTLIYYISTSLLFLVTILIIIALSTNNWQKSSQSYFLTDQYGYGTYTWGLWNFCKVIYVPWTEYPITNYFCHAIDANTAAPWIIACEVFYTLSACLNFLALCMSVFGIFRDMSARNTCIPHLVFWILVVSSIFQVITLSVYGGMGISDYSTYKPDYSFVIAAVAVCFNAVSAVLYLIELFRAFRESKDMLFT